MCLFPHCAFSAYKSAFAAVHRSRLKQIHCCLVSFNLDLLPYPTDHMTAWIFCQHRAKVIFSRKTWTDLSLNLIEFKWMLVLLSYDFRFCVRGHQVIWDITASSLVLAGCCFIVELKEGEELDIYFSVISRSCACVLLEPRPGWLYKSIRRLHGSSQKFSVKINSSKAAYLFGLKLIKFGESKLKSAFLIHMLLRCHVATAPSYRFHFWMEFI